MQNRNLENNRSLIRSKSVVGFSNYSLETGTSQAIANNTNTLLSPPPTYSQTISDSDFRSQQQLNNVSDRNCQITASQIYNQQQPQNQAWQQFGVQNQQANFL